MDSSLNKPVRAAMLIKFALPTILSMLFMSIFGAIDGIFVSRLIGIGALAAVNLVFPFFTTVLAIASMLSMGGSALVAKKKGEGKIDEARQNFTLIVMVAIGVSVVIVLVTQFFSDNLLALLGVDYTMHGTALLYLGPISLMAPFLILGMMLAQFMITDGRPTLGGIATVSGAVSNTVLNWIFIAQLDMGIAGAAWATGIGYSVPAIIGICYFGFFRNKKGIHFVKPKWDFKAISKASTNGISEFIAMISTSIVATVMNNRLMDMEGYTAVSAVGIVFAVMALLNSAYMGYSFGIAPIISYNFGANETDRLKKAYSISLRVILAMSLFALLVGFVFVGPLVRIYIDTSIADNVPVYEMAVRGFRIVSIGFLFIGFNVFASSMFTALNNGLVSGILSVFRTLIFILTSVLVFSHLWGLTGVWVAIPFAEALALVMSIFFFKKMKQRYKYA